MRKRTILIMAMLLVGLMPTLSMLTTLVYADSTTVYLDPSENSFNVTEVSVGYLFNVTAWVSNVSDLMGFQVALYYNHSVINCTKATALFLLSPGMPLGPTYAYFDSWGVAFVGSTGLVGATPGNGDIALAKFEFEIMAAPEVGSLTSDLIISYKPSGAPPYDTKLKDSTGVAISFTATDGHYEYVLLPEVYLDPSNPVFNVAEVSVGYLFNVTAWVSNVSDLMGFQVALYYNASVINMTEALLPTGNSSYVFYGQNDTAIGPSYAYFDSWGVGNIGFNGSAGTTTPFTGTGMLAVFEFNITAAPPEGSSLTSPLKISTKVIGGEYETKLEDSAAGAITFVSTDGSYTIVPEFLSFLMLPIFLILTLVALVLAKKLQRKREFEYKG